MAISTARRAVARIAVTGAGGSDTVARSFLRAELDGVRFVASDDVSGTKRGDVTHFADALAGVDMLVIVARADEAVDESHAAALAGAARDRGILVAAIVVDCERPAGPSTLLAALREAADMVMVVRDPGDVHAVVAALR